MPTIKTYRKVGAFYIACEADFSTSPVRVGVFPEREEVLIGGAGFDRVALHGGGTGQAEASQRAPGKIRHQSSVVDELLKFGCRCAAVVQHEIGFATQISRA